MGFQKQRPVGTVLWNRLAVARVKGDRQTSLSVCEGLAPHEGVNCLLGCSRRKEEDITSFGHSNRKSDLAQKKITFLTTLS